MANNDLVQEWVDNWASQPWPAKPNEMGLLERGIRQRLKAVEDWGDRAAAEIEALKAQHTVQVEVNNEHFAETVRLMQELERVNKLLRKYGGHVTYACTAEEGVGECQCGWDEEVNG